MFNSGNYNEGGYNNSPPYNSTADRGRDRGEGNGRRAASGRGGGGGQEGYQRVERGQYAPFERRAYNHIRIGLDQHPLSSISLRETITDSSKVEQSETNSPRLDGSPGKDQMYSEQPIRNRHNESFSAGLMKANSSVDTGNNSENLKSSHTYGICFFNPNHIISYDQLESHTTTCPDAKWFNTFYNGQDSDA
ncbi:hypothetical protein WR25_11936 isoform B [Diploscapter pachys]|uniref:Uncharacterized protein n=1 Tax=Diploscapter pachys TaxID=2018661 RepID=A0A2A2LTC0_9BILA|nr:hypothetical protein WR25_11936 isoform B [Diploscapter pachys]